MPINRPIWKSPFTIERIPEWPCPTCGRGVLRGNKDSITIVESEKSKEAHSEDDWDPEWIEGTFFGFITCDNKACSDSISLLGRMNVRMDYDYEEGPGVSYSEILYPLAFYPTPHPFIVHKEVPHKIRKALIESFHLYWMDTSSCTNKIRVICELIMDEENVPKAYIDRNRKKLKYTLHKRIEVFQQTKPSEAGHLMAIKWIGNYGSHPSDTLIKDDALDAYEILELVISTLYEKEESIRVRKLSKDIAKRKKPIGAKRNRKKKK